MLPRMTRVCACVVSCSSRTWFAPAGAAAAELPVGHAKGVSVKVGRHGVTFRFAKKLDVNVAALLRLRRHVELSCTRLGPLRIDGGRTSSRESERVPVPKRLTRLRLSARGQHPSFCTIRLASTGLAIVHIPVTQDGAVYVDERHTLFEIRNAVFTAADDAQGPSSRSVAAFVDELLHDLLVGELAADGHAGAGGDRFEGDDAANRLQRPAPARRHRQRGH